MISPTFLACWLLFFPASPIFETPLLVDFALADARGEEVTRADVADRPVLLIAAGRGGREASRAWGAALYDRLADELADDELVILRVADLRAVPGVLRKRITKSIARDETSRVLLDWEGSLARVYELDPDRVSLLVFDRDGRLVERVQADGLEPSRLEPLVEVLRGL